MTTNCENNKKALLSFAYGDADLSAEMQRHLGECETCQSVVSEYEKAYVQIDTSLLAEGVSPSSHLSSTILEHARLQQAVPAPVTPKHPFSQPSILRPVLAFAALLALFISLSLFRERATLTFDEDVIHAQLDAAYSADLLSYDTDLAFLIDVVDKKEIDELFDQSLDMHFRNQELLFDQKLEEIVSLL